MTDVLWLFLGIVGGVYCFWQGYCVGRGRGYAECSEHLAAERLAATLDSVVFCDCPQCRERRSRRENEVL